MLRLRRAEEFDPRQHLPTRYAVALPVMVKPTRCASCSAASPRNARPTSKTQAPAETMKVRASSFDTPPAYTVSKCLPKACTN